MPPGLVLTLDASMAVATAGLVEGETLLGSCSLSDGLAGLPAAVAALLVEHGTALARVVVVVGPGSFTGLRAAVALAHGVALAAGVEVAGVSVGAALRPPDGDDRLWTVVDSKRGRVFLQRGETVSSVATDELPLPTGPIRVAGDAAAPVVAALRSRGADAQPAAVLLPTPLGIAAAARAGRTRPAVPLYVDPPAARPGPAGRPAPA